MSDPSRPNFFVLLEIDPTQQWSDVEFEKVLKAKRIDWTKKANDPRPKVKLQAKQYLEKIALITQVMSDEASRKDEAAAAVKQQSQAQTESEQKFYEDLQLIIAKEFITKSEISTLAKSHSISEAKILKELNKQGITIREEVVNNVRDKSIDPIILNGIKENLANLKEKKSDLYQFIDLNQNTSISALQKKADDMYNQSQKGKRDTEATVIGNLVGYCKKVFANEEMREAYDIALQAEVYDLLKERINKLASSSDRTIYAQQFALLLEFAKSKKLDLEKSKTFIIEQAQERKLAVQIPDLKLINNKIACISCETLNDRQNNYCTGCRSSLKITCPSCGQVSTVEDRACYKCSFPIGNEGNIRKYLADTQQLLNAKLYDEAIANLNLAKQGWTTKSAQPLNDPLTQEIERYLQEAQQKQQQRVTVQQRLLAAINDRRFYEARTLLQQIEIDRINIDLGHERNRIETSIREAEAELTKARTLEKSGRDPVELYQNVLWFCKDCQPAQEALAKTPPNPAVDLTARVGDRMASLTWRASTSKNVNYTIVRKYRSRSISSSDGEQLATIAGTTYDDLKLTVGLPVFYAIYTNRENVLAAHPAELSMPIMLVDEVRNLVARTGDGQVSLSWQLPEHVTQVEVYRSTQPSSSPKTGERIEILDKTQAIDRHLANRTKYYYTVCCLFRDHTGKSVSSAGVAIEAIPEEPPARIHALNLEVLGTTPTRELRLSWQRTKKGNVAILLSSRAPSLSVEDVISQGALSGYGKLLTGTQEELTVTVQDRGVVYFTPVVLLQQTAYIGKTVEYANVDDVSNLKVQKQQDELQIRWDFPSNCEKVILSYSDRGFPHSHTDKNAVHIEVTEAQYKIRGYYSLKSTAEQDYFIVVHAIFKQDGKEIIASGKSNSSQTRVSLSSLIVIKYQIVRKRTLFGKGKPSLTIEMGGSGQLPDLVLVRKLGGIPLKKTDGEVVMTIPSSELNANSKGLNYELEVQNRSFGKLFLVDDTLYESMGGYIRINHPSNTEMEMF
jgi:predicted amidophosphoribosyltransferase